jgi:flavin reductase (DIM6/NTAB) family NADH-FMN oxidoreductase RutF
MPVSEEFKHTVGKAIGRIPSGVFILSAAHNDQATAMMASWVQQAAFDPPAVSVAIGKGRPIGEMIRASGKLALSIVPEGDTSLMKPLRPRHQAGRGRLRGRRDQTTPGGIPSRRGVAWIEGDAER